ncbi:MAG: DUF4012 domain-containing protein [Patescibacteria group bacterium]|nr:DUF4012 domain-containing protein [Patescibacteria group bacterium]
MNLIQSFGLKKKNKSKKRSIKWALVVLVTIFLLFVILTIFYYPKGKKVYQQSLKAKENLFKAQELIALQDYSQAEELIYQSNRNFNNARVELEKMPLLKFMPIISQQYQAIDKILKVGVDISHSTGNLVSLAVDIISPLKENHDISFADITVQEKRVILAKLNDSEDTFTQANEIIKKSNNSIKNISQTGLIGPVNETVVLLKDYLPKAEQAISQLSVLAKIIPDLAGFPNSKKFLFLLQNNTELRPTGGFIGTYGTLVLKDADILEFKTNNVYNLDEKAENLNIDPPEPLTKYNKTSQWFLRDSNWSPDFPTSAEKALWFYEQEGGSEKNFDGVIAITPDLIESLIELTGSITVHGVKFTRENFTDTLQYQVEKGFLQKDIDESQRKEIIGDLSKVLIENLYSLPQAKWDDLFQIIDKELQEKHFLLYFKNEQAENLLKQNNWGGQVIQNPGDYIMFIDTNLASLKTDPYVTRNFEYNLTDKGDYYAANLKVNYKNEADFTWKTTRYRTYFRLYVPQGSQLIDIIGTNEEKNVVNDLGKTYFGSFISIEPGEEKTITFKYKLPKKIRNMINDGNYQLVIQKQPGAANYKTDLNLEFHKNIKAFSRIDNLEKESNNKITFSNPLNKDYIINISLK